MSENKVELKTDECTLKNRTLHEEELYNAWRELVVPEVAAKPQRSELRASLEMRTPYTSKTSHINDDQDPERIKT